MAIRSVRITSGQITLGYHAITFPELCCPWATRRRISFLKYCRKFPNKFICSGLLKLFENLKQTPIILECVWIYHTHTCIINHTYTMAMLAFFLESTPLPSPHTVFLCQTLFNLFFLLSLCNDRWWWQLSLPWLRIPLLSVLYYCSVQKYGKVVVHKWNFLCLSHNLLPVILVLHLFVLRIGSELGPCKSTFSP